MIISLKSRQAPHTRRLTVTPLLIPLMAVRCWSTTLEMASRDSLVLFQVLGAKGGDVGCWLEHGLSKTKAFVDQAPSTRRFASCPRLCPLPSLRSCPPLPHLLSPEYLHLHSLHTRSNDIAPLARGTELALVDRRRNAGPKEVKADALAASIEVRAREVFLRC